ncbi:PREDICTED: uncharacterized protein LOC109583291 [Amphimedon queenslandica]|uniref:Uncharacterized protein n=1 Tax=Amphimedon queenslandica TaxID=400682 RepID=A0A1X7UGZ8_AMPQE|nr:PREDICTED: uncharacterized protein LOC109583291 [Amphimedon queenslandica]|eukprot:XP_019854123.1 PREDICTED: uncharacterized protein LOC109583291 [Amphimedon queenslandica]
MDQPHSLRGLIAPSVQTAYIPDQYLVGNSRFVNNTFIAQPPPRPQLIVQPPSFVRPLRPQQIFYQTNAASHQYHRPGPPPLIFHPRHSRLVQRPPVTPVQPTPAVMPSAFKRRPSTLQYFPASSMSGHVPLSHVQCNCICYQSKLCCCYSHSIVPCHRTTYHHNHNIYAQQQQPAIFQSCTRQTRYVHQNTSHATNNAPGFIVQETRQVPAPIDVLQPSARPEVLTPTDSDPNGEEETDRMEAQPEKRPRVDASPPYSPQSLIIDLDPDFSDDILINDKLPFEDFAEDPNSNNNNNNNDNSSCLVTEYTCSSNSLVSEDEHSIEGIKGIYALSPKVLFPQKDFVEETALDCTGVQGDDDDTLLDNESEQQQVTYSQSTELNVQVSVAEETLNSYENEGQEPVQSGNQCKTATPEEAIEFGISEVSVYEMPSPINDAVEVEELQRPDTEGNDDYITLTQEVSSLISVLASSIGSLPPLDDSTNILSPDSSSLIDSTVLSPLGSFDDSSNSSPDSFDDSSNLLPPEFFIDSSSASPPDSIHGPSNASPPALMDDDPSNSNIDDLSNSDMDQLTNFDTDYPSDTDTDDPSDSNTDDEFSDLLLSLDKDNSSISSPPVLRSSTSPPPDAKSSSPLLISIPLSVLDYDASSDHSVCPEPSPLVVSYPISVWLGRRQKERNDNSHNNNSDSSLDDSKSRLNKILDSSALLSAIDLYIVKGFFLSTLPKMEKEVLKYALTHSPATANSKAFYIGIELNLTTKEWVSFKHYGDSLDIFDNSIHM